MSLGLHEAWIGAYLPKCSNPCRADPEGALRLCMAIDISGWSDHEDSEEQRAKNVLVDIVGTALRDALRCDCGVRVEYSADAALVALPPDIDVAAVTWLFLTKLTAALAKANRPVKSRYRVRLRIGLEVAAVIRDNVGGAIGNGVNGACRLRDSEVARATLAAVPGDYIVAASDFTYQHVLRHAFADVSDWEFTQAMAEVPGKYSSPCWISPPAISGFWPEPLQPASGSLRSSPASPTQGRPPTTPNSLHRSPL